MGPRLRSISRDCSSSIEPEIIENHACHVAANSLPSTFYLLCLVRSEGVNQKIEQTQLQIVVEKLIVDQNIIFGQITIHEGSNVGCYLGGMEGRQEVLTPKWEEAEYCVRNLAEIGVIVTIIEVDERDIPSTIHQQITMDKRLVAPGVVAPGHFLGSSFMSWLSSLPLTHLSLNSRQLTMNTIIVDLNCQFTPVTTVIFSVKEKITVF